MLGFSYQAVRGTEFPLWFVVIMIIILLGLVVAIVIACFFPFKAYNKEDMPQESKEEISNYMGKDRLKKILFHYIRGRYGNKMYNEFISVLKECKQEKFYIEQSRRREMTGAFYAYTQTNGFPACNEWLNCVCLGHDFLIEACGKKSKRVTITDCFENKNLPLCDHFYTYYDENFVPKPNETELRGDTAQTSGFKFIKPFTDKNTTYKGIDRDICVCYDITKDEGD